MSTTANSLPFTKHLSSGRKLVCCLLLAGPLLSGSMASRSLADDRDRVGADAPRQERNAPANEDKFRLAGPQVPVVSVAQSPDEGTTDIKIRKSTAGAAPAKTAKARKARKSTTKTVAQTAAETKPTTVAEPVKRVPASYFDNQRVGEDAPHQERNSDVNARGARLFIWERE